MAGFTSVDTIMERIVLLLREYLAANVALIDTRNNAVATAGGPNAFTTPTIAAAQIMEGDDLSTAHKIRVAVMDGGTVRRALIEQVFGDEAPGEPEAKYPRVARTVRVNIEVHAFAGGGAETTAGTSDRFTARRWCNRVTDAIDGIMQRYPRLGIPSTGKAILDGATVTWAGDTTAKNVDPDSPYHFARVLSYDIQTIEWRST